MSGYELFHQITVALLIAPLVAGAFALIAAGVIADRGERQREYGEEIRH